MTDIENTEGTEESEVLVVVEKQNKPLGRPRTKPPRVPKTINGRPRSENSLCNNPEAYKAHRREYYREKLCGERVCPICGHVLNSVIALSRHKTQSKKCKLVKMRKEIVELRELMKNRTTDAEA